MKQIFAHLLSLCFFIATATCKLHQITHGRPAPYFRLGYEYNDALNGWLKLHRVPATWDSAHARCIREGAQLASPINGKFLKEITSIMDANNISCGVFTGIHDKLTPGSFSSIEGVPLELISVPWKKTTVCPEKFGAWIVLRTDGTLDSVKTYEEYPYVCYKKNKIGDEMKPQSFASTITGYRKDDRTGSSYKFHRQAKSWSEAQVICEEEDAHLVIINSITEARVLKELFEENPANVITDTDDSKYNLNVAFVGMAKWGESKRWLTLYGQTLDEAGYSIWAPNRPNGKSEEPYCGTITRNGMFDDNQCSIKLAFICERAPVEFENGDDSGENLIQQRSQ